MQGERDWESAMAEIGPPDDGPGNLCPRRMPLDSWSTSRADGRAKRRAAAGSATLCVAHMSNADMEHDGGRDCHRPDPDTGFGRPQAHRRMRPDDRPTSQWSFLFPIEAD